MRNIITVFIGLFITMNSWSQDTIRRSYAFSDGVIPRNVLESYLSRAITQGEFCLPESEAVFEENLRMIQNIGAKFIGRAAFEWTPLISNEAHFSMVGQYAAKAHEADPELVLQACIFEAVFKSEHNIYSTYGVDKIAVPSWVFKAFGLEPETRNFNYEAMLFPDGTHEWLWGGFGGAPDITQLEAQMYFYYRAARYIDAGYEAIHWGQAMLVGQNDAANDYAAWFSLLGKVRAYAKENARRRTVMNDAHVIYGMKSSDGHLLMDSHAFPQRLTDICGQPYEVQLEIGHGDAIYTKSFGGITPSGWECESLPYMVEFDNSGADDVHTCDNPSWYWPWGWDEATWFARNTPEYREKYLRYAVKWIAENDPAGNLQVPGSISISADPIPITGTDRFIWLYRLNNPSPIMPHAFGEEKVVKELWDLNRMHILKPDKTETHPLASVYSIKFDSEKMTINYSTGESEEIDHASYHHVEFTTKSDSILKIIPDTTTSNVKVSESFLLSGSAYPNPFHDHVFVEIPTQKEYPVVVSLFDLNGRLLFSKDYYREGSYAIETSKLENGFYVCRFNSPAGSTTYKLIKQ
jgi:hypothetical protein